MAEDTFYQVQYNNNFPVPVNAASLKPDKAGTLRKEGGKFRTWKKRYFILSGNGLFYFENENSTAQKGVLVLNNGSEVSDDILSLEQNRRATEPNLPPVISIAFTLFSGGSPSYSTSFYITGDCYSDGTSNNRTFVITAPSEKEKEEWMRAIRKNISKITGVPLQSLDITPPTNARGLPEQINTDSQFAQSFFGKNLGAMRFSNEPIPMYATEDSFKTTFTKNDSIYLRFSYEHAIRNYPAPEMPGKTAKYPPEQFSPVEHPHEVVWVYFLYIDGQISSRGGQPDKRAFYSHSYSGPPPYPISTGTYKPETAEKLDEYAIAQTAAIPVSLNNLRYASAQTMMHRLSALPAGEHKIKIEVRYFLDPSESNRKGGLLNLDHQYPYSRTPLSHILSSGEFTYVSTGGPPIPILPPSLQTPAAKRASDLAYVFFKNSIAWHGTPTGQKRQIPLKISIKSEWREHIEKVEVTDEFGRKVTITRKEFWMDADGLFYHNPQNGWERECCVIYDLTLRALEITDRTITFCEPFQANFIPEYDADDFPQDLWNETFPRCPPEFRK